jgi:hypothetical protein
MHAVLALRVACDTVLVLAPQHASVVQPVRVAVAKHGHISDISLPRLIEGERHFLRLWMMQYEPRAVQSIDQIRVNEQLAP